MVLLQGQLRVVRRSAKRYDAALRCQCSRQTAGVAIKMRKKSLLLRGMLIIPSEGHVDQLPHKIRQYMRAALNQHADFWAERGHCRGGGGGENSWSIAVAAALTASQRKGQRAEQPRLLHCLIAPPPRPDAPSPKSVSARHLQGKRAISFTLNLAVLCSPPNLIVLWEVRTCQSN